MLAIVVFTLLGGALALLLVIAEKKFAIDDDGSAAINDLLPCGQCGQGGYAGCAQAAAAMVRGEASPDCCPPGGEALARTLAERLGVELSCGPRELKFAAIDESQCNGCTRCLRACPFDAILGANKCAHVVISALCTGCQLCANTCPEKAITLSARPALGRIA